MHVCLKQEPGKAEAAEIILGDTHPNRLHQAEDEWKLAILPVGCCLPLYKCR